MLQKACRLAKSVAFLHATVITAVFMRCVRNPAFTAKEWPWVEHYINNKLIKKCFTSCLLHKTLKKSMKAKRFLALPTERPFAGNPTLNMLQCFMYGKRTGQIKILKLFFL